MKFGIGSSEYIKTVAPALNETLHGFTLSVGQFQMLASRVTPSSSAYPIVSELVDAMNITLQRVQLVFSAYNAAISCVESPSRSINLNKARNAVLFAMEIIKRREECYRVPLDRIAAWKFGPTAYNYGYLWTVHSGYYFIRSPLAAIIMTVN